LIVGNQFDSVMQRVCSWSCDLVECGGGVAMRRVCSWSSDLVGSDGGVQSVELQSRYGQIQKLHLIIGDQIDRAMQRAVSRPCDLVEWNGAVWSDGLRSDGGMCFNATNVNGCCGDASAL
jgi:hypothetical protein